MCKKTLKIQGEEGYWNLSDYEPIQEINELKEDERVYKFNREKIIKIYKNVKVYTYSDGDNDLYDPEDLYKLIKCTKGTNVQRFREEIINSIPSEFKFLVNVYNRGTTSKMYLYTEEALYHIIINSNNKESEYIRAKLLKCISEFRATTNKEISNFLEYNAFNVMLKYIEFGDIDEFKLLDYKIFDKNIKFQLMNLLRSNEIRILDVYQFPVIDTIPMNEEKIGYYLNQIEKVKLANKIELFIRADRVLEALAFAINNTKVELFDKIKFDIMDGILNVGKIDEDHYIFLQDLEDYLLRYKESRDLLENVLYFLFNKPGDNSLLQFMRESLFDYEGQNEDYNYDIYIEYYMYIKNGKTKKDAKKMIQENYKEYLYE